MLLLGQSLEQLCKTRRDSKFQREKMAHSLSPVRSPLQARLGVLLVFTVASTKVVAHNRDA